MSLAWRGDSVSWWSILCRRKSTGREVSRRKPTRREASRRESTRPAVPGGAIPLWTTARPGDAACFVAHRRRRFPASGVWDRTPGSDAGRALSDTLYDE
jgi:hypothetical protein